LNRIAFGIELINVVRDVLTLDDHYHGMVHLSSPTKETQRPDRATTERKAAGFGGGWKGPSQLDASAILWHYDQIASVGYASLPKESSDMSDTRQCGEATL
jgi:hypothetical protein